MDSKIDMSLDDIIRMDGIRGPKRNNNIGRKMNFNRGFGNQRFNGSGGRSGFQNRNFIKRPYTNYQNRPRPYQNRNLNQSRNRPFQPATLHISNLVENITSEDLYELFSTIGNVNRAFIHYDQNGISLRTADVEMERRDEAIAARNKFNNVPLDGLPMRISLINQSNDDEFTFFLKSTTSNRRTFNDNNRNRFNRASAGSSDEGRRSFNSNRNQNRKDPNITADDLDRDLDEWRMKTEEENPNDDIIE